jgi:hypothetical protein
LHRAGQDEEHFCRFCRDKLPDWRSTLTPTGLDLAAHAVAPVMAVVLEGVEHKFIVEPGDLGRDKFEREVREFFNLTSADTLEFTFDCEEPEMDTDERSANGGCRSLSLEGVGAYDAAFHCASITASVRNEWLVR